MSAPVSLQLIQQPSFVQNSAAAAATQQSNVVMGGTDAPLAPLPKTVTLAQLVSLEPKMQVFGHKATVETINSAVDKKDYFSLVNQLNQTIANEWSTQKFDYDLRDKFLVAFTKLQQHFIKDVKKIQNGEGGYASLPKNDRDTLALFASEGRGGESVRIYSKIILDSFLPSDKYPGRIMSLTKNNLQVRLNDKIPGEVNVLTAERAAQFIGNDKEGKPEEKYNCKIDGELILEARVQCKKELMAKAVGDLSQLSDRLSERVSRLGFSLLANGRAAFFLRGEQGSGKSSILADNNILGLSEDLVFNADGMKKALGGNLSHHESAAIADEISLGTKGLKSTISVKTNTKERDLDSMKKLPKNTTNVIMDIDVSFKTVQERLANRPGRMILPEDIAKGHEESVATRAAIIQAAILDSNINYRLYNNDGSKPVVVAEVINKKFIICECEMLLQAVGGQAIFETIKGY